MNYAGQRLGDHDHWLVEGLTGCHVQLGIVSTEGCFEWLASTTRMQHLLLWWCTQCSTWKILYLQPVVDMEYIEIIGCFWFFFGHEQLLSDRNGLGAIELAESTFRERFSWACLCHLCGILRYGLKLVWISVSGGPRFTWKQWIFASTGEAMAAPSFMWLDSVGRRKLLSYGLTGVTWRSARHLLLVQSWHQKVSLENALMLGSW